MLIVCNGATVCIAAITSRVEKARDVSPPFVEPVGIRLRQPHPQLDAIVEIDDIERTDIVGGVHDPFTEAEAMRIGNRAKDQ